MATNPQPPAGDRLETLRPSDFDQMPNQLLRPPHGVHSYRALPVIIQALALTWDNWCFVPDFCGKAFVEGRWVYADGSHGPNPHDMNKDTLGLLVRTLEGEMLAREGDYLVRGLRGEIYPVKAEIFLAKYALEA